jgi:hypothetical protein
MSPDLQREIATKGGVAVSKNKKHMQLIGQIGGSNSHLAITGKARLRYVPGRKGRLGKAEIVRESTQ